MDSGVKYGCDGDDLVRVKMEVDKYVALSRILDDSRGTRLTPETPWTSRPGQNIALDPWGR